MQGPCCRLYVLLARKAPVGVIFRRGPTRHVRLIRWDLGKDTFMPGQWLKGRVFERRSDLSPRGDFLIYFAAKHTPPLGTWTAISRPPWLTALALWPKGDCWGGGGLFDHEQRVLLNHWGCQMELADGFRLPRWLTVGPLAADGRADAVNSIEGLRLVRDGWALMRPGRLQAEQDKSTLRWRFSFDRLWQKPQPGGGVNMLRMLVRSIGEHGGPWSRQDHDVIDSAGKIRVYLPDTDWADWDGRGDLLFSRDGKLFRLPAAVVDQGDGFGQTARCLADFGAMRFETIAAPADAIRW